MELIQGGYIKRSQLFISAGHALFEWLFRLSQDAIVVLNDNGGGVKTVVKREDEIIQLNFDYEIIGKKFFDWRYTKEEVWELSKEEVLMFFECCHAARYYLSKQNYNIGEDRDLINWLYNCMMKDLGVDEEPTTFSK